MHEITIKPRERVKKNVPRPVLQELARRGFTVREWTRISGDWWLGFSKEPAGYAFIVFLVTGKACLEILKSDAEVEVPLMSREKGAEDGAIHD